MRSTCSKSNRNAKVTDAKCRHRVHPFTTDADADSKMNQSEHINQTRVTGEKRKARENACMVLVLPLIGRESGANFGNQSQSKVKQEQSKDKIQYFPQSNVSLSRK